MVGIPECVRLHPIVYYLSWCLGLGNPIDCVKLDWLLSSQLAYGLGESPNCVRLHQVFIISAGLWVRGIPQLCETTPGIKQLHETKLAVIHLKLCLGSWNLLITYGYTW